MRPSDSEASAASLACEARSGCQIAQAATRATTTAATAPAARLRTGAERSRPGTQGGPRPATYPAHTSAISAVPATSQVQSISEWAPKVTTTASRVSSAAREPSAGWRTATRSAVAFSRPGQPRPPPASRLPARPSTAGSRRGSRLPGRIRRRTPAARAAAASQAPNRTSEIASPTMPRSAAVWGT